MPKTLTVGELIQQLNKLPADMPISINISQTSDPNFRPVIGTQKRFGRFVSIEAERIPNNWTNGSK